MKLTEQEKKISKSEARRARLAESQRRRRAMRTEDEIRMARQKQSIRMSVTRKIELSGANDTASEQDIAQEKLEDLQNKTLHQHATTEDGEFAMDKTMQNKSTQMIKLDNQRQKRLSRTQDEKTKINSDRKTNKKQKQQDKKKTHDNDLVQLSNSVLDMVDIDQDSINFMAESQTFTSHANLGLAYYHLCSSDPRGHIANDESFQGVEGEKLTERVFDIIEGAVGQKEAILVQESAKLTDTSSGRIAHCASCCETMYECHGKITETVWDDLHESFLLTPEQNEELATKPVDLVEKFVSVICHNNRNFHLNPELIWLTSGVIVLCKQCKADPLQNPFSIASGCDFGRLKYFPKLTGTNLQAVLPVRNYNTSILIKEHHATGHHICFPSDGARQSAKELPCTDDSMLPLVTFLGSSKNWKKSKPSWNRLYEIDVKKTYEALRIWVGLKNPHFEDVVINDSAEKKLELQDLECTIEKNMVITEDETIFGVSQAVENEEEDDRKVDPASNNWGDNPSCNEHHFVHEAILPPLSLATAGQNLAVEAFLKIVKADDNTTVNECNAHDNCTDADQNVQNTARPVIQVTRGNDPLVEWDENDVLLGGAFPFLFLLGKGLPKGGMSLAFHQHCFNFYDGRFNNELWIATCFNQLQRHACIQKTTRIALGDSLKLQQLGTLANSAEFRAKLVWASANPATPEAMELNKTISKLFSVVGKGVPFSPFERISIRPMLGAMRFRFSAATMFHTGSPPEFDDDTVLRVACITEYNNPDCKLTNSGFKRTDLPSNVLSDTGIRMNLTRQAPALAAQSFIRIQDTFNNDLLRAPLTADTRVSRNYTEREKGILHRVSAHNTIVETQQNGRLHWHKSIYLSVFTPTFLQRVAAGSLLLITAIASILDSFSMTRASDEAHSYLEDVLGEIEFHKRDKRRNQIYIPPRAVDHMVPQARDEWPQFQLVAEKRAMLTNRHVHSFTCEKSRKGQYMCRLAFPRGVHEGETRPLLVKASRLGDPKKGVRPELTSVLVVDDAELSLAIDSPYVPLDGEIIKPHLPGLLVWEQQRPERDKMLVEANPFVTNILGCHNNASLITGVDGSGAIEEYTCSYMTKEGAPLRQGATVMLAALNHISTHSSRADDSGTLQRTGMHLAQRTVNSFSGSQQWSMPLMVYALLGFKSYTSTESFRFVFPYDNLAYLKKITKAMEPQNVPDHPGNMESNHPTVQQTDIDAKDLLGLITANDSEDLTCGGAASYKVNGRTVFVTQAESYAHRGPHFASYSQLEFECVVKLLVPNPVSKEAGASTRGRKRRPGILLDPTHPLYTTHHAFINTKSHTPILAGPPTPVYPGSKPAVTDETSQAIFDRWTTKMDSVAKYVIALMVPWSHDKLPEFLMDRFGLAQLAQQWDSKDASLINRQRIRMIQNLLTKGFRDSHNEKTASNWRERDATIWKEVKTYDRSSLASEHIASTDRDSQNRLSDQEVLQLARAVSDTNQDRIDFIETLTATCERLFNIPTDDNTESGNSAATTQPVMYSAQQNTDQTNLTLAEVQSGIHKMCFIEEQGKQLSQDTVPVVNVCPSSTVAGPTVPQDLPICRDTFVVSNFADDSTGPAKKSVILTKAQMDVIKIMMDEPTIQKFIFLHSGGGTGKSTIVHEINNLFSDRNECVSNTCPTGVGATHLPRGKTFHSVFRVNGRDSVAAAKEIDEMKRALGGDRLRLIVIDEVSMLTARHLMILNLRLRSMYNPNEDFGGISVLLMGDFVQMPPIGGTALYKCMYPPIRADEANACVLFSRFTVVELVEQMRASKCDIHKRHLIGMRALPKAYPHWDWNDTDYRPMTTEIIDALTTELTAKDIAHDEGWSTDSTCLTTSNLDRNVINASIAKIYGKKKQQLVIRWKRQLEKDVPLIGCNLLYSIEKFPELFGYFVYGAPGQILDNGNGNVGYGIANGTPCTMVSLGWDDPIKEREVSLFLSSQSVDPDDSVIDIPHPPDFIIVKVNVPESDKWPLQLNLSTTDGELHIPIGLKRRIKDSVLDGVTLAGGLTMRYYTHAVDLAFAVTVWKCQGGTYNKIIAVLEPSPGSKTVTYEALYVMLSRVTEADGFRCMPLVNRFRVRLAIGKKRPDVCAVRWRMSISAKDGKWYRRDPPHSSKKAVPLKPKSSRSYIPPNRTNKPIALKATTPKSTSKTRIRRQTTRPTGLQKHAQLALSSVMLSNTIPPDLPTLPLQDGPNPSDLLDVVQCTEIVQNVQRPRPVTQDNDDGDLSQGTMTINTGLPIADQLLFLAASFTYEGLNTMQPGRWFGNEPMDLFGIMEAQNNEKAAYIMCSCYRYFCSAVEMGQSNPMVINIQDSHEAMESAKLRALYMLTKSVWISILCHNANHWQVICIINPSKPSCTVLMMDSLVGTMQPSNSEKVAHFVSLYIRDIFRDADRGLPPSQNQPTVQSCNVLKQPNHVDCGPYALLNLKHLMLNIDLIVTQHDRDDPIELDSLHWFTLSEGSQYRTLLRNRYRELLSVHAL